MNQRTALLLHLLFIAIASTDLLSFVLEERSLEFLVKPLIMPALALYFLKARRKKALVLPVLLAFLFSWGGDVFLLFSDRSDLWFFAGVGSFFLAQCTYISIFIRHSEFGGPGLLKRKPAWIAPFLLYLAGILALLLPGMEGIMPPIIFVYALSLLAMSAAALNRKGRVHLRSFRLVFAGSLFFVLSDSMIALDRFYLEIPQARILIMSTYMAAQYLLMMGLSQEE